MELQERIEDYWSQRAKGYAERTREELSCKEGAWLDLIQIYAPTSECLQVLDIGTGPGFFPIIMSRAGHKATGIDCAPAMLEQAKHNAAQQGVNSEFFKMDAHRLEFASASFDMLICRNLTWTLPEPEAAYKEWWRVLRPGGRLLIFDANWYLRLFDERLKAQYEVDLQSSSQSGLPNPHAGVDLQESEQIGRNLPLSRVMRPDWDEQALTSCGFSEVLVQKNISERVWDAAEQLLFKSTPLFVICALK